MDKYEYNMKLEQIKKLIRKKDYATAARIADTIDWYKVKNNQTIVLIADVYEASGRYEQAKENLKLAYDRSGLGRQIAYKLVKICIKCGELEEAEDYYDDFVSAAPRDISKYLLQYELAKAKGEPLDKQIAILEQYLEEDMDDRWAFELAKLYHKSGQRDKCIEQCDTIMLWFSDGRYVEKAMDLKMIYTPLTKAQQERYEARWREKTAENHIKIEEIKVKEVDVANKYNTQNIQNALKESMDELFKKEQQEKDEADSIFKPLQEKPEEKAPQKAEPMYDEAEESVSSPDEYIERMEQKQRFHQRTPEEIAGQRLRSMENLVEEIFPRNRQNDMGDTKIFATTRSLRNLGDTKIFNPQRLNLEEQMIAKEELEEEKEAPYIMEEKTIRPVEEPEEEKFTEETEEVVEEVEEAEVEPEEELTEEAEEAVEEVEETEVEPEEELAEEAEEAVEEVEETEVEPEEELTEEAEEAVEEVEETEVEPEEELTEEAEEAVEEVEEIEVEPEIEVAATKEKAPMTLDDFFGFTDDEEEEVEEEAEPEVEAEEKPEEIEEEVEEEAEPEIEAEEEPEEIEEEVEEEAESEIEAEEEPEETEEEAEPEVEAEEEIEEEAEEETEPEVEAEEEPEETEEEAEEEVEEVEPEVEAEEEPEEIEEEVEEETEPEVEAEEEPEETEEETEEERQEPIDPFETVTDLKIDQSQIKEEKEENALSNEEMKEVIKDFIGKYSGVQALDKQMLKTLQNVIVDDNCNIFIMGDAKSGKTSLGIDIIKVVNKIKRNNNRRIAKISAEKLNGKELDVYFEKLENSDLFIENISTMAEDTIAQLVQAIKNDKENRIVVIEDEKLNAERFLERNPEMQELFVNVINVKQNKIRDWVSVAEKYAEEQGYEIDEIGTLALHAKIDQLYGVTLVIQRNQVEGIIDNAIKKAEKGGLIKKLFGKKKDKILSEEHFN